MQTGITVFLAALLLELVLACWTLAIAKVRALTAALTSVMCVYLGTFVVKQWLDDPSMVHWAAAGHGIGSFALLWWVKRQAEAKEWVQRTK